MMKKVLLPVLILLTVFSSTGCTREGYSGRKSTPSIGEEDSVSTATPSESGKVKAIVVYFSATNHTEAVAKTISDHIESAIYKLEPTHAYLSADLNWTNSNSRVVQEYQMTQRGERVDVELNETHFDGFVDASYVFLGAPVWWQQLSWVIENFVSDNDFSNKTIIPFGTSSSSGYNLENLTPLTSDDKNVTWIQPQRFPSSVSSETVISWIDSLGFSFK